MKTSKRKNNLTGLKVKFIPPTNDKGSFFKLTQTNNKKSCLINGCLDTEPIGFFTNVLNRDKRIKSFNLMIDNTQNQYYTFVIDVKNNEIHNILENFKNL